MTRSNRGAARISAVWLISVGVLFLAAMAFGFIAQGDLSTERDNVEAANARAAVADARFDEINNLKRDVSVALGWYDRASADPVSDVEAVKRALEDLRTTFPDLSNTDADFETALPKILAAYEARGRKIGELEQRVSGLEGDVATAQAAATQVAADKDQVIAGLRQQIADDAQNASQRQTDLETRLASANDQVSERDTELRQARADLAAAQRSFTDEKKILDSRIAALTQTASFAADPNNQQPDGKVIEVSSQLPLAWIDIGASERLTRGTRFRIEASMPANGRLKAWGEVVRVEEGRAEMVVSDLVDPYDPVVSGDVIVNPLYDPVGGRNAVLVGRFSGAYNEAEITRMLERMSINVQPEITITTHFLIVGGELWNDPETNEPLEEPVQPWDLEVYKEAEALGLQIIPLQNIREFFRFGTAVAGQ